MTTGANGLFGRDGSGRPLALVVVATLTIALGVLQWMELLLAQQGGEAFCELSATFSCEAVWAHPIAKTVQRVTAVPVAGWGVVWALGAFAAALWVVHRRLSGAVADLPVMVASMFSAAGIGAALALFALSLTMGVYCLTCLATYVLVIVYALFAFKQPLDRPWGEQPVVPVLAWSAGLVVAGYLLVLWPGTQTPVDAASEQLASTKKAAAAAASPAAPAAGNGRSQATAPVTPTSALGRFLAELSPPALQAISDALHETRTTDVPDLTGVAVRHLHHGAPDAKLKLVDFSDIRCGHCAQLAAATEEMRRLAPNGSFSLESRWFPLDAECNPKLDPNMTDGTGVRCAAARAMICLEGKPGYDPSRMALFAAQRDLAALADVKAVLAKTAGVPMADLERCARDPATEAKLQSDIEYAWKYRLPGTPLVLANQRKARPVGPYLYALILAEGNLRAPEFGILPPPKSQ